VCKLPKVAVAGELLDSTASAVPTMVPLLPAVACDGVPFSFVSGDEHLDRELCGLTLLPVAVDDSTAVAVSTDDVFECADDDRRDLYSAPFDSSLPELLAAGNCERVCHITTAVVKGGVLPGAGNTRCGVIPLTVYPHLYAQRSLSTLCVDFLRFLVDIMLRTNLSAMPRSAATTRRVDAICAAFDATLYGLNLNAKCRQKIRHEFAMLIAMVNAALLAYDVHYEHRAPLDGCMFRILLPVALARDALTDETAMSADDDAVCSTLPACDEFFDDEIDQEDLDDDHDDDERGNASSDYDEYPGRLHMDW